MANDNGHGPDNLVLRMLRQIDHKLDRLTDQVADLILRMSAVEAGLTLVNSRLDTVSVRVDRLEKRMDRIERRLELSGPPAA